MTIDYSLLLVSSLSAVMAPIFKTPSGLPLAVYLEPSSSNRAASLRSIRVSFVLTNLLTLTINVTYHRAMAEAFVSTTLKLILS